jgi:hypothetical protein
MLPAGILWRHCNAIGAAEKHPTKNDGVEVYWAPVWATELSDIATRSAVDPQALTALADEVGRPNPGWADALKAALRLRRSA